MKDVLKATVLMLMDWVGMKCFNQLCVRKYLWVERWGVIYSVFCAWEEGWVSVGVSKG